jgi:prevent-host-death family protein
MTNKVVKLYRHKKSNLVSIAEGKKEFSRLIQDAENEKKEYIVTKRGKPVAAILPYTEYKKAKRTEAYRKIMAAREIFSDKNISVEDVIQESKKQLEKKP